MEQLGRLIDCNGKRIYLVKGIFDYFDDKNFPRLLKAWEEAKGLQAQLYVGLYTDDVLERTGHKRRLKGRVSDQDRINLLEALDFIDGAFCINSLDTNMIEAKLKECVAKTKDEEVSDSKYEIGYASGGFCKLHKGHVEHLREMKRQCKKTVVAINSDKLIEDYKGKRTSINEEMRLKILSHIRYVDIAIITDRYDKMEALEVVKQLCGKYYDAIFVGSDWRDNPKWESLEQQLNERGIKVVFTERPEQGISTTAIDKEGYNNRNS